MKFKILHGAESASGTRTYKTIATATTLEDGVAILIALAAPRMGTKDSLTLVMRDKSSPSGVGVGGISCDMTGLKNDRASILAYAKQAIAKNKAHVAVVNARRAWLASHGTRSADYYQLLTRDQAFATAVGKNDFAAAELRAKELGIAA